MHEDDRSGTLTGTPIQLAQLARCTGRAMVAALRELAAEQAADILVGGSSVTRNAKVLKSSSVVTVRNRRMYREAKARAASAIRQARWRRNQESNAPSNEKVTIPLSSSSSTSPSPERDSGRRNAEPPPDEKVDPLHHVRYIARIGIDKASVDPKDRATFLALVETCPAAKGGRIFEAFKRLTGEPLA
jgi:hypothetical protein